MQIGVLRNQVDLFQRECQLGADAGLKISPASRCRLYSAICSSCNHYPSIERRLGSAEAPRRDTRNAGASCGPRRWRGGTQSVIFSQLLILQPAARYHAAGSKALTDGSSQFSGKNINVP
jgi:hypothetical protein